MTNDNYTQSKLDDWLEIYRFGRADDLFIFEGPEDTVDALTDDYDNLAKVYQATQNAVGDVVASSVNGGLDHYSTLALYSRVAALWDSVNTNNYTLNHRRLIGYTDSVQGVIDWALGVLDDLA